MNIQLYDKYSIKDFPLYIKIYRLTENLKETYPKYYTWFWRKFIPSFKSGKRKILTIQDGNQIIGCALLKDNPKKLCTFYIDPLYRRQGLGKKLLNRVVQLFVERPEVSVSDKHPGMIKFLVRNGFKLSYKIIAKNNTEYYFDHKGDQQKIFQRLLTERER